jgi:hypothetical protein
MEHPAQTKNDDSGSMTSVFLIAGVIAIGAALRVIAWINSVIIDPDGPLYIEQARAIYYHRWDLLANCGPNYVANYPFFIAACHFLIPGWEVCARAVSFLFGTAFLIPLYLMLRCFTDRNVSALTTLTFAALPLFVGRSVDVLRDSTYWFFLASGLYFFVVHLKQEKPLALLFCSISLLMASWARVEAVLFIPISFFYLASSRQKLKNMFVFALPVILVLLAGSVLALFTDVPINSLHRGGEILDKISATTSQYQSLRDELKVLADSQQDEWLNFFLSAARTNMWLVALGLLLNRLLESFLYIFFVILIIGLSDIRKKLAEDRRFAYFLILAVAAFILLYVHTFHRWVRESRYMVILLLPCAVFIGLGYQKIINRLKVIFPGKAFRPFLIIASLVILCTLPKNLTHFEPDKVVFKEIGQLIATREGNHRIINISASQTTQLWVSFYANLHYKGALCFQREKENSWRFFSKSPDSFFQTLKDRNIQYLLWTQRQWPQDIDLFKSPHHPNLKEIGKWYHPDTGAIILYKVNG